jgi:hypothetical protein
MSFRGGNIFEESNNHAGPWVSPAHAAEKDPCFILGTKPMAVSALFPFGEPCGYVGAFSTTCSRRQQLAWGGGHGRCGQ